MNISSELDTAEVSKSLVHTQMESHKFIKNDIPSAQPDASINALFEQGHDFSDPNPEWVKNSIGKMQDKIDRLGINLEFTTYGENGDKIAIVVKDKITGNIIREIPAKELQKLHEKMNELIGSLLNEEV